MQNIEVKQGQSFFDVVIVATGNITNVFSMALANNISVTDSLEVGEEFSVIGNQRKPITGLFGKTHYPATATTIIKKTTTTELDYLLPAILPMSL